ncbi:divergent polysaccharide deacetylase family protein [Vannielia litorea]|uniref:divergent polysaccharide deacetylase family protein n=1 Tax=Vannielia litorea TaxID=1217970 RepID=UPI001C9569FB|nr:divergent polysaccharide deacetylase family protein [Vannielia litorea]MBY6047740.1 divergent polysaccharide deacetylase family protein [Vannielia litorea]MBY6075154.1 divergent polysaccharide deacetylase family protein [Vannielia litorea]
MGKGLLSGVAWGALASVLVLGGASVMTPLPEDVAARAGADAGDEPVDGPVAAGGLEAPEADAAPEAPEPMADAGAVETEAESDLTPPPGSEFARAGEDRAPEAPGAEAEPVAPAAPEQPDVEVAVAESPAPDTAPPAVPETATEGVAAPVAPVVEETAPVIGGSDGAMAGAEAPDAAAQPEAGAAPEVEAEAAPDVPRSTPETVGAEAVAAPASDSEAVAASESEAAPVAAAEVASGEQAERAEPVRAESGEAATGAEVAPEVVAEAAVEAVAPASGSDVARVAGGETAERAGEVEVAAASEAEVVTGTEPVVDAGEAAGSEAVAPAEVETAEGVAPEAAPEAVAETAPEAAPELAEEQAPEVVEIVEPEAEVAARPAPEAEAPVAETPAVPVSDGQAPAQAAPEREAPAEVAEAPATAAPERAAVERETELPADPSAPPSSVPITERQPRTGTGGGTLPRRIVTNGESGGGFGKRVVPLTERNKPGSRLPAIGASAEVEEAAPVTALAANAAPFANEDGKPVVSVILFDVGDQGVDRAALKALDFPVTFAVDPTDPGAAETAQGYRDAGFEVLILPAGLPSGATPQDLETTLQSYFGRFPGAMGLLATGEEGVMESPALTRQLLAIAGDTGHGLVFVDSGLNSARRGAESAGLPSTLVWKVLDGAREDGGAIGRTLDRAAFRAGQEGEVVVMGHSFGPTVESLMNWAAGSKGQSVALAPVSAVLMR